MAESVFYAMNSRDFTNLENITAEEAAFDFPGAGRIEGKKRIILFLKALLRKYKTLTFQISEIISEGEKSVAVWTNKGEHIDGRPYSNSGMTLFYFSQGKIIFISDYFKDTSFVKN